MDKAFQGLALASQGLAWTSQGLDLAFPGLAGGDGWTNGWTAKWMEFFPILQDFVPYWGRCPKSQLKGAERL